MRKQTINDKILAITVDSFDFFVNEFSAFFRARTNSRSMESSLRLLDRTVIGRSSWRSLSSVSIPKSKPKFDDNIDEN